MQTQQRAALVRLALALAAAATACAGIGVGAASTQGFVGDRCAAQGGGVGVCRSIINCPEVRAALQKNQPFVTCSYDGFTPIVCCPSDRVATRMCTKYGEAVYRYEKTFNIPPQRVKVDQCGIKGLPFIAGGEQASLDEFPHMALLGYGDNLEEPAWACGGSLISERFVLTAAHCIITTQGKPKVARLGELNLRNNKETYRHVDYPVAQSVPHPEYSDGVYYHDVGLLRLERDVAFTGSVRPACLQALAEIGETEAIASGWGFTDWATPEITDHLMKVKLPIQKTEVCSNSYKTLATTSRLRKGIVEESMVCAGTLQGGKDTCRGDSGGPLQVKLTTPYCMYSVVGITSFGKGNCGTSKSPAIYTRVSHYLSWIEGVAWPNQN